jgi:hypothetical protein
MQMLILGLGIGLIWAAILALSGCPAIAGLPAIPTARFSQYYYVGWSRQNAAIFNRGYNLNLTLDKYTGTTLTVDTIIPTVFLGALMRVNLCIYLSIYRSFFY